MSTNGIIARAGKDEGTFTGRYHHWDSMPTSLGQTLVNLYRGHFKRDLGRMLQVLLDEHPAGWSSIVDKDFRLKAGYTELKSRPKDMPVEKWLQLPQNRRPACYCHGERREEEQIITDKDEALEWAYVFDEEQKTLHVLTRMKVAGHWNWQDVGRIELDSDEEINWAAIECGENFERCGHYAWHHGLAPKTCNLSTQVWLGKRPFDFHDAVAFIVNGKRLRNTGSGGDSDFLNRTNFRFYPERKPFPSGVWIATVIAGNGRPLDVPVAKHADKGFVPFPGVQWVMPPTKTIEHETLISAEEEEQA